MTLTQAANLQRLCYDAALSLRHAIPKDQGKAMSREDSQALAALVKSWDTARDAVRVARGKPLPGSRRPAPEPSSRSRPRPPAGPIGPAELEQEQEQEEDRSAGEETRAEPAAVDQAEPAGSN